MVIYHNIQMAEGNSIILKDKAYNELKSMVDNGQLRIVFIFGPPRSGTTAFERQVHEICGGININHPELEPDVLNKKISVWENILNKVSGLDKPATVVIKTTSDFIAPKGEISLWRDLSEVMFCCFRNPILQLESVLKLNTDYLFQNKFKRVHQICDDHYRINTQSIYDDVANAPSNWKSLYANYGKLGEGFLWVMIHWEYDRPELLSEIWRNYFNGLSKNGSAQKLAEAIKEAGASSAEELIDRYKNSVPDEFKSFPKLLRDALVEWSFGWVGTQKQVAELGKDSKLVLVDFTSAQLDPEGFSRKIEGVLRNSSAKSSAFNIGHDGDIAFDSVRTHQKLLPPDKKPLQLEKFPGWMHEPIQQSLAVYTDLLRDRRLVTSFDGNAYVRATRSLPNGHAIMSIDQVDPVFTYCQLLDFASTHSRFAKPRIQAIREQYPAMEPYFQMCDRVAQQNRIVGRH